MAGPAVFQLRQAGGQHRPGAPAVFLRRLENEVQGGRQLGGKRGQGHRQAEENGGVAVVAAGVHDSGTAGGIGAVFGVSQRQGVHVGPQGQGGAVFPGGVQPGDDAVAAHPGALPDAVFPQYPADQGGGLLLPARKLGVLVQVAPPADDPVFQRGQAGKNLC